MADLGTIGIAIEVRGREALRQIESDMTAVDRTAKSAARSFEAFERAGLKTAETFTYMSDASKKRLADEQRVTAELIKQRTAAEQLAKANAQAFQSRIGGNLGLGAQGISASASASAMEAEIERLRQKYDTIYASSQLYERSLQELNRAHMLGVTSAKQHEAAVESLNAEYQAFQNGTSDVYNRFAHGVQQTGSGLNNAGVLMQQLGYQAGDFIVQVQSGTNAFVAFGQQATQLVAFLPMLAAEAGIAKIAFMGLNISMAGLTLGLSIIIPLLTAAGALWMRTSESSDKATESVNKQAQAYQTLIDRVAELQLKRQMEASGIQTSEEQVVQNEINRLLQERVSIQEDLNRLENAGGRAAGYAQQKQEQKELLQIELDKNQAALEALRYQQELDIAQRRRANEVRNEYRERERLKQVHADAVAALGEAQNEQRLMTVAAEQALSKYSMMRTVAAGLAANLAAAADATLLAVSRMNQLASMEYSGRGGDPKDFSEGGSKSYSKNFRPFVFTPPSAGSGGGSSAAAEQEDALQRLREQLALENELLGVSEAQERVIRALGDSRANYTQAEIAAITAEIEAYNQKLEVMKQQQQIANVIQSSMEDAFMGIITGTESVKDAFKNMAYLIIQELYRVLVVQRLVGSFTAGGGGILGAAFSGLGAGLMGGAGAATVNGFALTGGMRASGGSMMAGKSYLVGERGPELVIPRHSSTVVNANQTSAMGSNSGATVVNNNISVTGSDAAMVRAEVAKMIPQITNATKAAVIDAKQRGGQMAAAFR